MSIQTATTGQLEDAQRIAIEQTRYTAEHNAPMMSLIEKMRLGKGEKSITVPKVGQMSATNLADGVDLASSEDIGMTSTSLTTGEVGLKVILTDKLVRQENEDAFRIVGRQMGDAVARKKDRDAIALFPALNGGVDLGSTSAGYEMEIGNVAVLVGFAKANKFPKPVQIVQHPWATFRAAQSVMGITAGSAGAVMNAGAVGLSNSLGESLLKDFFEFSLSGVPVYQDGNIDANSTGDGTGAVFSREAMVYVESVGFSTERERDASLRATELVVTCDYGVFELDDTYGAPFSCNVAAEAAT
jgi:hypothetical protein